MSNILLRTLRRITALECSVDEFKEIVFDKLDLSVYEVSEGVELTRAHAEHAVSFSDRPQARGGVALRANDGGNLHNEVPGETAFEFTQVRHREIRFLDDDEARAAAVRVYEDHASRTRNASADELKEYAGTRLRAQDPEWLAACVVRPRWMKCAKGNG